MTEINDDPTTAASARQSAADCITLDAVRACFMCVTKKHGPVQDWVLLASLNTVRWAKNNRQTITTFPRVRAELFAAIRTILDVMPEVITESDTASPQMEWLAKSCRDLLEAAEPFRPLVERRLNRRSEWHPWAEMLAVHVQYALPQRRPPNNPRRWPPGFAKATSPGITIVAGLLNLAGFDVRPEALIELFRSRNIKGG